MQFRTFCLVLLITIVSLLLKNSYALPRDSSVVKHETVVVLNNQIETKDQHLTPGVTVEKEYKIPGRIFCQYEEPTEDLVCQQHCLPKGYTYGICVSNTCSCI
ncbi:unnamed protein product [Parnassius mnemosyne]|uniref:Uncharacterized protein n=1 Tax=Parnassius mnemosyne TaxID=213953 RepID=A0AAV1M7A5_9NEOP